MKEDKETTIVVPQKTFAQYLNGFAGKGLSRHKLMVAVSSKGDITITVCPDGSPQDSHNFTIEADKVTLC